MRICTNLKDCGSQLCVSDYDEGFGADVRPCKKSYCCLKGIVYFARVCDKGRMYVVTL